MQRRDFIGLLAAGAVATSAPLRAAPGRSAVHRPYKAVAFDAFPIFDPRPISVLAEKLFPGKGAELSNLWRTRQFEYQWLRTLTGHFADFWKTTQDALVFAARLSRLDLTASARDQLMNAYLELRPWPEAPDILRTLQRAGLRLVFLSNMTKSMLDRSIANGGLEGIFEFVLSSDVAHAHKPDPRAYRMAPEALKLSPDEIVFAAFAGWDAAGAKSFGFPTFWVNRLQLPSEELGITPDAEGADLNDLLNFVTRGNA
ncbi:MAG TPA: haloacid dehalogenase type II [Rhodanobacteraceae bacterium]|nr:haloacid dehalogenase type II [Rhodanobacteraceae bacterium]